MGAPLTIEQIILNHNVGVNISDAKSLQGLLPDAFAKAKHTHSAGDIVTGVMDPERLPMATAQARGIVGLSSSTDSESQNLAATPYAVKAVKNLAQSKANSSHTHAPADLAAGQFAAIISAMSNKNYTTRQIRNTYLSPNNPKASNGQDGDIWFVYE